MSQNTDLFHALADLTGCLYISDLQFLLRHRVLTAVTQLAAEQYPTRDWVDALCYFSEQHHWSDPSVHLLQADAARRKLLRALET